MLEVSAQLFTLPRYPSCSSTLGMPSLKQLLGQHLQELCINGCFDRAIHSLQVELLSDAQADWFFHPAITKFNKVIMETAAKKICFS